MTDNNPRVSVVIPAFNAVDTLAATLRSVAGQTHRNLEILVVDDGSTDDTASLVEEAGATDPRIHLLGDGANHGRSRARNTGIDAATGEWVGFVDADDLWAPDRVERLLGAVATFPEAAVATSDHLGFTTDEQGHVRVGHWFPSMTSIRQGVDNRLDLRWWFGDRAAMMQPFARRSFLETTGVRYPEGYSVGEDNLFNIRLVFSPGANPVRAAECLSFYRDHSTGRTVGSAENLVRGIAAIIDDTGSTELAELAERHLGALCWIRKRGESLMDAQRATSADTDLSTVEVPIDSVRGMASLVRSKVLQEYATIRYRRVLREKASLIESLLSPP